LRGGEHVSNVPPAAEGSDLDMTGERRIPAPREKVWDALNDPAVLKASIPGCEKLEKLSDSDMAGTVAMKIGPISARFSGRVQLLDREPPTSYRIVGEGQGGAAGFAKGGANVSLADDGSFTVLTYAVQAQVGGKIAQLGARLVDATAKSMADAFFDRFVAEVTATPGEPVMAEGLSGMVAAATERADPGPAAISLMSMIPKEPFGYPRVAWVGIFLFIIIFLLIFGSYIL
jgi:carbon monoxide dehydrogenase subunit G